MEKDGIVKTDLLIGSETYGHIVMNGEEIPVALDKITISVEEVDGGWSGISVGVTGDNGAIWKDFTVSEAKYLVSLLQGSIAIAEEDNNKDL